MNILAHFTAWLTIPLAEVTRKEIGSYVDHLMGKRLSPKTITCHLQTIRLFFDYLTDDEGIKADQSRHEDIDPSAETATPAFKGRPGGEAPCLHL